MNMHTTRWSPDTCGCVIEYEWDRDLDPSVRTHKVKRIVRACNVHKLLTKSDIWNYVMNENVRKNGAIDAMQVYLETDSEELFGQFQFTWRFEGSGDRRILYVSLPTLGVPRKVIAQRAVDDLVGLGLVVVE